MGILCACTFISCVESHKILVLVPLNGEDYWNYMKPFVKELIDRGHDVTCLTNIAMNDENLKNYTEILIDPPFDPGSNGNKIR